MRQFIELKGFYFPAEPLSGHKQKCKTFKVHSEKGINRMSHFLLFYENFLSGNSNNSKSITS